MRRRVVALVMAGALSLTGGDAAFAQSQPETKGPVLEFNPMTDPAVQKSMRDIELKFAYDAAARVAQRGPVDVPLSDQAVVKLPAGYVFVPQKEGSIIMGALGNPIAVTFLGLIMSESGSDNWFIAVDFNKTGFLRDNEAATWNVDRLLEWLKAGVEAANDASRKQGLEPIDVKGWAEPPNYDPASHRLAWAAIADERGAPSDSDPIVNYHTFLLGRDGYLSLNLIANRNALPTDKKHIEKILESVTFNEGRRYADFVEGKDRVAEFGLSALVATPGQNGGLPGAFDGLLGRIGKLLIILAVGILIVILWRLRSSRAA